MTELHQRMEKLSERISGINPRSFAVIGSAVALSHGDNPLAWENSTLRADAWSRYVSEHIDEAVEEVMRDPEFYAEIGVSVI